MVLISACLYGLPCRYDGRSSLRAERLVKLEGELLLPLCPEQLGGLPTPRPAAELSGGDGQAVWRGEARVVRRRSGEDVTAAFIAGAQRCVYLARLCGVRRAILKANSPSCGVNCHWQNGALQLGPGVAAAALAEAGVALEEWE
ncbi:MAG: DUF523 domain-containing protein [Planctomycetota bacterium]|nr:DUF523 domain-containing protein [Planctomycetota bacterium]